MKTITKNIIKNIINILKRKYERAVRPGKQAPIVEDDGMTLRNDLLATAFLTDKRN